MECSHVTYFIDDGATRWIAGDSKSARFDSVVQFTVTQPTLSVTATQSLVESEDGEFGVTIPLYCVRPDGIQQYTLDPALCYAGTCSRIVSKWSLWRCCDLVFERILKLCGMVSLGSQLNLEVVRHTFITHLQGCQQSHTSLLDPYIQFKAHIERANSRRWCLYFAEIMPDAAQSEALTESPTSENSPLPPTILTPAPALLVSVSPVMSSRSVPLNRATSSQESAVLEMGLPGRSADVIVPPPHVRMGSSERLSEQLLRASSQPQTGLLTPTALLRQVCWHLLWRTARVDGGGVTVYLLASLNMISINRIQIRQLIRNYPR